MCRRPDWRGAAGMEIRMTEKKGRAMKKRREKMVGKTNPVVFAVLALVAMIQLFPLYWMFSLSLKNNNEIYGDNLIGLPHSWEWGNFLKAVRKGNIGQYFFNSVVVTGLTIFFTLLLSVMVTYAIVRLKWKLSKLVYLLFIVGLMLSVQAVLLPLYVMMRPILNSRWALVIPYVAFAMPTAVVLITGALKDLPKEIEEAAFIDGASIYRIFFELILPLLAPILSSVGILTYLNSWNELMLAVTMVSGEKYKTITVGINDLIGKYSTDWGIMGAALSIATLPTVLLFIFLSKNIQKSLTLGAVKG